VIAALPRWQRLSRRLRSRRDAWGRPGDIGVKVGETNVLHVGVAAEAATTATSSTTTTSDARARRILGSPLASCSPTTAGTDAPAPRASTRGREPHLPRVPQRPDERSVASGRSFLRRRHAGVTGRRRGSSLRDIVQPREERPTSRTAKPSSATPTRERSGRLSPGGGRITLSLRYSNVLDYFESGYTYASNMTHDGMLDSPGSGCRRRRIFLQGAAPTSTTSIPRPLPLARAAGEMTRLRSRYGRAPRSHHAEDDARLQPRLRHRLLSGGQSEPVRRQQLSRSARRRVHAHPAQPLGLTLAPRFRNSPVIGTTTIRTRPRWPKPVARAAGGARAGLVEYRDIKTTFDAHGEATIVPARTPLRRGVSLDYYIQRGSSPGLLRGGRLHRTGRSPGGRPLHQATESSPARRRVLRFARRERPENGGADGDAITCDGARRVRAARPGIRALTRSRTCCPTRPRAWMTSSSEVVGEAEMSTSTECVVDGTIDFPTSVA
jgi:hypothetical protein